MLEACGLKGHRIGGAQISPQARELHRERRRRPHRRRARADGGGAAPSPRAVRRRASPRGRAPRSRRAAAAHVGAAPPAAKTAGWPASVDARRADHRAPARRPSLCRARARSPRRRRRSDGSRRRAARSSSASACSRSPPAPMRSRARPPSSRSTASRSSARRRDLQAQVRRAVAPLRGSSLLAVDGSGARAPRRVAADGSSPPTTTAPSRTRFASRVVPETPVAVVHRGKRDMARLGAGQGHAAASRTGRTAASPRIWVKRATPVARRRLSSPWTRAGRPPGRSRSPRASRPGSRPRRSPHDELVFRLRSGLAAPARRADRRPAQARDRAPRAPARCRPGAAYVDVSVPGAPCRGHADPQLSGGG